MLKKCVYALVCLCLHTYLVEGQQKSSLVFVIDDTGSMGSEIAQVKERVFAVFDAVLSSNGSIIDEFVLVTFNDPTTALRIITTDRDAYKSAVSAIRPNGGGDCPEMALAGIELGLQNSKPNSFLYVFTDASAKDYDLYERVKSLSLKKSTQITFLLTGHCGSPTSPDYLVYEKLAKATSGQAFELKKSDVDKVFEYIIASIKHQRTTIYQNSFTVTGEIRVKFTVDSKLWDVMIAISATTLPTFRVVDSSNVEVVTEVIATTGASSMVKLNTTRQDYTIIMNTYTATTVMVTGSTTVVFQHGFSTIVPGSLNETSTKPIEDISSNLAIQLENTERDILLQNVEIRDEHNNVLLEKTLFLINEVNQFYSSTSFVPPKVTFRIAVNGNTPSGEKITRVSSTTIEYQKPALEETKNLAPVVTIIGDSVTDVEYNRSLSLRCKVNGFPQSDIIWKNQDGVILRSTVTPIDLPYDYMSLLNIDNVKRNETFTCTATNSVGEGSGDVRVNVRIVFDVLVYPSDVVIGYGNAAEFSFIVYASTPVTIWWYKDGVFLKENENLKFSDDNSTMTIGSMEPDLVGNYTVLASDYFQTKSYKFEVLLNTTGMPVVEETIDEFQIQIGINVNLSCRGFDCNITWNPFHDVYLRRENRFMLHMTYKYDVAKTMLHYDEENVDDVFLYDLMNGSEDCPDILCSESLGMNSTFTRVIKNYGVNGG